jgi:DNA-binding MarR family transcriptional regulator
VSFHATDWAWRQKVGSPTGQVILVAIACHADDTGRCWPSRRRLAAMCEVDRSTVGRWIAELERRGLLKREPQFAESGRRAGTLYKLPRGARCAPRGERTGEGRWASRGRGAGRAPNSQKEPSKESSLSRGKTRGRTTRGGGGYDEVVER